MKNFKFKIDGVDYEVSVNELEGNNAEVVVNGKSFNVELDNEQPTASAPVARVAQSCYISQSHIISISHKSISKSCAIDEKRNAGTVTCITQVLQLLQ